MKNAEAWPYEGFAVPLPGILHSTFCLLPSSRGGAERLLPAFCCSKLDVGCWMFGLHHKHSEYKPPILPHSGWSGGTMVQPWYHPIPIEHPGNPIFDQTSLSKSVSRAVSGVKRLSALDVGRRISNVPAATPAGIRLVSSRCGIICR